MWTREYDGRRYVCWKENGKQRRMLEHRWVWQRHYGPIPPGHHVHHKDGNRLNNEISNLACLDALAPWTLHNPETEVHRVIGAGEHRKCQRCTVYQRLDQFTRRSAGTYHPYCKPCVAEHVRGWRAKHR